MRAAQKIPRTTKETASKTTIYAVKCAFLLHYPVDMYK